MSASLKTHIYTHTYVMYILDGQIDTKARFMDG